MTIDVADLRKRAERTFPQVYPSELTELLDAYEELHRYDADMEAGGDWLPLHLREAVAGSDPEQRAVVTEWYWRTNLLIGGLQTERDRLRAALAYYAEPRNHHDDYLHTNDSYDDLKLPGSRARAALEGRE